MDLAEISHSRTTLEFLRGQFVDRCEDGCHGHVYPGVDWAKIAFDLLGRGIHGSGIRHVSRNCKRSCAKAAQFASRFRQPSWVSGQQGDVKAISGKFGGGGSTYARPGSGNDSDFPHARRRRGSGEVDEG
jgi:hypothetical protein